jgi:hypothetical protein
MVLIESSAHADRITQVAHHGLISPGIPDPILIRRVVHERPHLDASRDQSRHHQSGELSCRADGQHSHAPPQLSKTDHFVRLTVSHARARSDGG